MKSLLTLFFTITLFSFSNTISAQNIEERIARFKVQVLSTNLTEDEYVASLSQYFSNKMFSKEIAKEYCDNWQLNLQDGAKLITSKTKDIKYNSKDSKATVISEDVWLSASGRTIQFICQAEWIKKNDQWYRKDTPMVILDSKIIALN